MDDWSNTRSEDTQPILPGKKNGTLDKRVTILEIRHNQTYDKCKYIQEEVKELKVTIHGEDDKIGVMERLRLLEQLSKDIKKIAWAILLTLLTIVAAQLYNIIQLHPLP